MIPREKGNIVCMCVYVYGYKGSTLNIRFYDKPLAHFAKNLKISLTLSLSPILLNLILSICTRVINMPMS